MKVVNNNAGLPEFFDVKEQKKKWFDTENCQLWDTKFTMFKRKHNWRRCGRCIWDKCSLNERALSRTSTKKHRVCDRCDFKLENYEFENTYKGILKAEDEVKSFQKSVSQSLAKDLQKKIDVPNNDESRQKEKKEYEEKIQNAMDDLQYVNKSKNLAIKIIKNADQRLDALKEAIEVLNTQKFLLT